MATFKGLRSAQYTRFGSDLSLAPTAFDLHRQHEPDPTQPGTVFTDLQSLPDGSGGCREGATLTSPARAVVAGKDVVMVLHCSAEASLAVQESTDGTNFATVGVFPVPSSERMSLRFTPGASVTHYRAQLTANKVCSRLNLISQSRN